MHTYYFKVLQCYFIIRVTNNNCKYLYFKYSVLQIYCVLPNVLIILSEIY